MRGSAKTCFLMLQLQKYICKQESPPSVNFNEAVPTAAYSKYYFGGVPPPVGHRYPPCLGLMGVT